jgi:hypothetical protein
VPLEVGEGRFVVQGGMLSDVVVVVDIAHGLVEEVLLVVDVCNPRDVELIVVRAVGAFDMGILFTVPFVILDQSAAKAANELSEFSDLEPGLPTELFAMVDGEDDLGLHAVRPQPRNDIQVPAQAIGPGLVPGVGHQFEAGGDIQGTPLVVRDATAVQMDDLLLAQCFAVADELEIDLHNLKGFG